MEGWIKLHRKMTEWEWYKDKNTKTLFIHLLLTANHAPKKWKGQLIERGQLITSINHLSKELDLSIQQIRNTLKKLKSTNEITIKSTNKNSVITIEKYDIYQINDFESNKQNNTQTNIQTTRKPTTNKNIKNEKNIIIYNNIVKIFNEKCYNLSKIKKITDKRKKAIDKFLKEYTQEQFEEICAKANESNFLTGKNDRGWKADFDFLLRTDKATSILEGKYDNTKSNKVTNYNNYKQREYDNLNYIYANRR